MGRKRYQWLWAGMILLSLGACANVSLSSEEWATLNVALREAYLREKEQQFGVLMNAYVDAAGFTKARMNIVADPVKMMLDRAESYEQQRLTSGMEVSTADFKHVLAYTRASRDRLVQLGLNERKRSKFCAE